VGKVILEKIVLKNWHAFEDNEFNISELSTLITGMNASGKTTLLDALSVILDGANSNDFNVAVKDEGERRTISGALHYVMSGEPTRTGRVTGLILAQFHDQSYNIRFLNGVFLISKSYSSDSSVDQRYFSVINASVDDPDFAIDFEKCKIPGQISYPNKKTAFENFFQLRKMQQIKPDMYKGLVNSVLRAKLDCTPADFVRKNILPEDDKVSSIETIKSNYKLLDDREKLYTELSEEAESLKKIRDVWYQLKNGENEYAILSFLKQKLAENQLTNLKIEKESLSKTIAENKVQKTKLEEDLSNLNVKYGESKSSNIVLEKKKELTVLNRELLTLKTEAERMDKLVNTFNILAREVRLKKKFTNESSEADINELLSAVETEIDGQDEQILELRAQNQKIKQEIKESQEALSNLRKGKLSVSTGSTFGSRISAAKELAEAINETFKKKGIDDTAAPLFELIDSVKDTSWQPAIETLLGTRRIGIVVNPENEQEAMIIQNSLPLKADTDIILSSKLKPVKALTSSVAAQITTSSETTRFILDSYYGSYVLCDNLEEYNSNDYALMKTGMFKNKSNSHKTSKLINMETQLIGKNTVKESIAETEARLSTLTKQEHMIISELNQLTVRKRKLNNSMSEAKSLLPINTEIVNEYNAKLKLVRVTKEEIESLLKSTTNHLSEKLQTEIKELKAQIDSLGKMSETLIFKEIEYNKSILYLEKLMEDIKKQITITSDTKVSDEQIDAYFKCMKPDDHDIVEISKKQSSILNKSKLAVTKLKSHQTDYNTRFNKGFSVGLEMETYQAYAKRLAYLEGKAFIEIKSEIKKLKESFVKSKAGVFKGIAESFKFAIDEVERINSILEMYEISGNKFKIHIGPLARKRDLYRAINIFSEEEMVPEYIVERLDDCFEKMISSNTTVFSEYADYRNYLDCDVMIQNGKSKSWKSFSKEKGNFSGGQKETPYYMCLAAALSCKAYKRGGIRLIVLDEAFKNMDQVNKVKALSMFKQLNLQTLLFTSNSDLADCTDHIYVITKYNNRIITAFGKNGSALKVIDKRINSESTTK